MPLFNQQQPTDAPFFINASLNTTGDYAGLSEWAIAFETVLNMVIVPAMFSFITLIGIVGNVAVIIIIISRRNMRSLVNILLLNLACGDFVFLTLGVPFMAYHYASLSWQLGEWVCKMVQYVLFVSVYLTIYTLVSIAIARFIVIVYSNSVVASYWLQSTKFAFACIVLLWLVMTLINLPILTLYELRYFGSYVYCGVNDEEKGRRLFLSFFFCAYLCPLLLIATFHFGISRYLKSRLPNNTVEIAESNGTAGKDNISRSCAQTSKPYVDARERNEKVSRLLLSIVVVFAACWLPMHLLLLLTYFGVQPLNWPLQVFRAIAHCMAYSNSCLNPIVYNYASFEFRQSFSALFKCSRTKTSQDIVREVAGTEQTPQRTRPSTSHQQTHQLSPCMTHV